MTDHRLVQVYALLSSEGLNTLVSAAGHAGDVLAVQAPVGQLGRLQGLAPELKQLGFRYVALELPGAEEPA